METLQQARDRYYPKLRKLERDIAWLKAKRLALEEEVTRTQFGNWYPTFQEDYAKHS